jgi:hypothetical protein
LKKESKKIRNPQSAIRNNWSDAFSAQRPYSRATSLLFRRKGKEEKGRRVSWILPLKEKGGKG